VGCVSRILVQEGRSVQAGQLLADLERARPNAAFEENRAKVASLAAAVATGASRGRWSLRPCLGLHSPNSPSLLLRKVPCSTKRKRSLQQACEQQDSLAIAQEEFRLHESLFATGDTSQLEVMRAKRQVGELQGRINAVRNRYRQEAHQEASKLVEELSSSRYRLEERESVLGHTEIAARGRGRGENPSDQRDRWGAACGR